MTLPATPPATRIACSPSRYSRPSTVTVAGSYAARAVSTGASLWIALSPRQARPECAATPEKVTRYRHVPLQPPSTTPSVGSSSTAKSPSSSSGAWRATRARPERSEETSSWS